MFPAFCSYDNRQHIKIWATTNYVGQSWPSSLILICVYRFYCEELKVFLWHLLNRFHWLTYFPVTCFIGQINANCNIFIIIYLIKIFTYILYIFIPLPNEVGGGVYWIHLVRPSVRLSVCPSVRPSVCRRHGFRSISQVCFGISISNACSWWP